MTPDRYEHGPLVEAWLKEPTFVPATDLARVSRAIAQNPQRRAWTFRLPHVRIQTMLDATRIAAAVAIIAISGSLLATQLMGSGPDGGRLPAGAEASVGPLRATLEPTPTDGTAEATTRPQATGIRIPDELPAGVDGDTIETEAGPLRWLRLSSEDAEVPAHGQVVPWGDGIAIWQVGPMAEPATLWASDDGVTWQQARLPDEIASAGAGGILPKLDALDGRLILHAEDGRWIWVATKDEGWQRIDTTLLVADRPEGWNASWTTREVRLVDGRPVVEVSYRYKLPRRRLGIPTGGRTGWLHHIDGHRYGLCGADRACGIDTATMVVTIKPSEDGLVVRDDRTGERLGLLKGAEASEIYEGTLRDFTEWYAIDGDMLVRAARPSAGSGDGQRRSPPTPPAGGMHVFDTGATWAAAEKSHSFTPVPWLYLDGEWIEPSELGFAAEERGAWEIGGADDVTLIWTWGDGWSSPGLLVVEAPSDT